MSDSRTTPEQNLFFESIFGRQLDLTADEEELMVQLHDSVEPRVLLIRARTSAKFARTHLERVQQYVARMPNSADGVSAVDALLRQVDALTSVLDGEGVK